MLYVALLFSIFAVVVGMIALIVVLQDRRALRRAIVLSSSSSSSSIGVDGVGGIEVYPSKRKSGGRAILAYGWSVGPVGDGGLLVTATGGAALGVGSNNGPNAAVEPPSDPASALDQNAISVTRSGKLRNLYVTITATSSDESVPMVTARISVWTAACGSDAFAETPLLVRKTDVGLEPTISCLANVVEAVPVRAGDRIAVLVRVENPTGGALVTALSAGFELHPH